MISFLCVHRSSPCLPSNKRYGVTTTLMSLSHENVYEREKVAISFLIFHHVDTIICMFTGDELSCYRPKKNTELFKLMIEA